METDPAAQVETVHRAAKRGFLPCYICILILSCFAWRLTGMAGIAWKLLLFLSAYELFGYYRWRHDARRAAESGRFLDTPGSMRVQKAVTAASGILLVCTLIFTRSEMRLTAYTLTLVGLFLVMAAVNAVKLLLKRLRVPRAVNFAVTMLLSVVFAVALTTGVLWVCWHFFVSKVMPFR